MNDLMVPASVKEMDWYAGWRPKLWSPVIHDTFERLGWGNLHGKRVLEIGYCDGKMATLFARLGCDYTGYEHPSRASCLALAEATAKDAGVSDRTRFLVGDFMEVRDQFDIVFVKSVLYHIEQDHVYQEWLSKIHSILAEEGRFVAIENGVGLGVNYLIRRFLLKQRYVHALLYNQHVESLFRKEFPHVDVTYHYVLSHLMPFKTTMARLEKKVITPRCDNCFIASVICDK